MRTYSTNEEMCSQPSVKHIKYPTNWRKKTYFSIQCLYIEIQVSYEGERNRFILRHKYHLYTNASLCFAIFFFSLLLLFVIPRIGWIFSFSLCGIQTLYLSRMRERLNSTELRWRSEHEQLKWNITTLKKRMQEVSSYFGPSINNSNYVCVSFCFTLES